jgi:hypothetical protein
MLSYMEQTIIADGGKRQQDTVIFHLWDNTLHAAWAELGVGGCSAHQRRWR